MSINFLPGNFLGETLTEGGKTWTWDGQKWNLSGSSGSSVNGNFVLRTGDVMTGNLVMDGADIEIDNGKIEFEAKGDTAYVQNSDNRFARIVSRAPKNTSDGTTDYTTVFGIKVDLDEGNTFKNQFAVNNRDGDIVKVTSGTGPTVQFGTNFAANKTGWDDPKYEGSVKIEGIPTPAFDNPEPTIAVNKEYVDKRDEVLQQEIIELEEEIDAIAPSVERGMWEYEVPGLVPHIGTAELVLPSYVQQITDYVFEVTWDGNIDESDCSFEWKAMKGGTDVSSSVFSAHHTRSGVDSARVTAYFTDEAVHQISCKVSSNVSAEEFETPQSNVDVQFFDNLPKIAEVVIDTPSSHEEGEEQVYTARHLGDAEQVSYAWSVEQDKAKGIKVGVFNHELNLFKLERTSKRELGDNHPAIPLLLQAFEDAMTRIEQFIKFPDDVFWQHRWTQVNAEHLESNINVPWDQYEGDQWKGLYCTYVDGGAGLGASCTRMGANDLVIKPNESTMAAMAFTSFILKLNYDRIKNDTYNEYFQRSWMNLFTHELLHAVHIIHVDGGWYKPSGYGWDLWETENFLHESLFPKTIATYRQLTGDDSYTMMPALGPLYSDRGFQQHPSIFPHTREGKVYPGYESIIAIDENHYNRSDITIMEIAMLVDQGWEEVNPGTSENDNPTLHWTDLSARSSIVPEDAVQVDEVHDHEDDTSDAYPANARRSDLVQILGYEQSELAKADPRFGPSLMNWEPVITGENTPNAEILIKHTGAYDITATASSTDGNDGPKYKTITQVVNSLTDAAISSFSNPYSAELFDPGPGKYHLLDLAGSPTGDFASAVTVKFSDKDATGADHYWNGVEVGETLQILNQANNNYLLSEVASVNKGSNYIELGLTAEASLGGTDEQDLGRLKIFTVSSGNATDFVLKTGDTMTGNLVIDRSDISSNVETRLELIGSRSNSTNAAAAIKFTNDQSSVNGYLTYKSYGGDNWFTFTQDVDLNSKGIHSAARLRLNSGGHIASGVNERIIVRTASSDDNTAGTEIRRPGDNKRTFSIRGKVKGSNTLQDIFWAYGNSGTTGDAINYTGLITANTHIATKGYVDGKVGTTIVYRNGAYYIST